MKWPFKTVSAVALFSALVLAGVLAYAGALISANYNIISAVTTTAGGPAASALYRVEAGALGQGASGGSQSASYVNAGGFAGQALPAAAAPAADLGDAYVYPNPFKPNTPGPFQSDKIKFKKLPAKAEIKIFAITGKQVAKLDKTDTSTDYYDWNVQNSDGEKLASGVYVFYITSPGGGKARGKFAVIR